MNTVWIVMPILLLLMFLLGTELKYNAFANVARNPRALIVGIVGQIHSITYNSLCTIVGTQFAGSLFYGNYAHRVQPWR